MERYQIWNLGKSMIRDKLWKAINYFDNTRIEINKLEKGKKLKKFWGKKYLGMNYISLILI